MFVETTTTRIEYILQTFLINNGVWLYSHQSSERYLKKYNNSVLSGENSAFSKKKNPSISVLLKRRLFSRANSSR